MSRTYRTADFAMTGIAYTIEELLAPTDDPEDGPIGDEGDWIALARIAHGETHVIDLGAGGMLELTCHDPLDDSDARIRHDEQTEDRRR